MESTMLSIKCKFQACSQAFGTISQLKQHQVEYHNKIPCPYADCIASCGRKSDMKRHCKNQHQLGKYVCNGCGYVQRYDILRNHLRTCNFRQEQVPVHPDTSKNDTLGLSRGDSLLPGWLDLSLHADGRRTTEIESLDFQARSMTPAEIFGFPTVFDVL
ncbi:hypothetical protein DL95DRAFT_471598 [Leptodontidium sp. 2 PMI_412]|nr:hypothetical protein DL95DRAFT_471598 [Leptodontidium sp. 2 PMI_412]